MLNLLMELNHCLLFMNCDSKHVYFSLWGGLGRQKSFYNQGSYFLEHWNITSAGQNLDLDLLIVWAFLVCLFLAASEVT